MSKRDLSLSFRCSANLLRFVMTCITRKDWHGAENLPAPGIGFIAVSNHVSYVDPLTFAHYLYNHDRVPRFLAKAPLFKLPVIGWLLRNWGQIPVYRGTSRAKDAIDEGQLALRRGEVLAVFPEGTLTRDPELWPMVPRTGVARMALETGVPVIPVAQWGQHRVLAPYGKVPHLFPRKKMTIVAGPEIDLSEFRDRPIDAELLRAASDRIMDVLTAMLEEIRGEKAPAERYDMRKKGQTIPPEHPAPAKRGKK